MIINAGIDKIVVKEGYPDELSMELLEEAGLDPMARAETLSPEDFAGLTEIIFN